VRKENFKVKPSRSKRTPTGGFLIAILKNTGERKRVKKVLWKILKAQRGKVLTEMCADEIGQVRHSRGKGEKGGRVLTFGIPDSLSFRNGG